MTTISFREAFAQACGDAAFKEQLKRSGAQAARDRGAELSPDGALFFDALKGTQLSQDAKTVLTAMETIRVPAIRICKSFPQC